MVQDGPVVHQLRGKGFDVRYIGHVLWETRDGYYSVSDGERTAIRHRSQLQDILDGGDYWFGPLKCWKAFHWPAAAV